MRDAPEVLVDSDDVQTIARVITTMSESSRDGWETLNKTAEALREGWVGRRGDTFEREFADLRKRVEAALDRLDEIPPKLAAAMRTFDTEDTQSAYELERLTGLS